ncbi:MAG: OB-fold nucleic acid binding domain-containing protein [archaeon]
MIEQKRLTAQRCRIKDIISGKYQAQTGFDPNYVLADDGRKLSRVHVLATVVSTYLSDDKKYGFVVMDDATGMIRLKAFQDTKVIQKVKKGDIVDVIGRIRQYNNEVHIYPEIVKRIDDPNYETLRKIELVQMMIESKLKSDLILSEAKKHKDVEGLKKDLETKNIRDDDVETVLAAESIKEDKNEESSVAIDIKAVKNLIIKSIEELDDGTGVEYTKIVEKVGLPESVSESAIDELLAEGSCYEPRPGRIKAL